MTDLGAEQPWALADRQLDRVRAALNKTGLRFFDAGYLPMGAGLGVPFGQAGFTAVTVMAGNYSGAINLASGVLMNVQQSHKLRILELCNDVTSDNPEFPVFLHLADEWDVMVQQRVNADSLLSVPDLVRLQVEAVCSKAAALRGQFSSAGAQGRPYLWNQDDLGRLMNETLM